MKNIKIYNINSKVKYKLCIGAIGLGVIATLSGNLLGNINNNLSKNNKSIYEYTEEELDEVRAVVKLEYKNSNLITEKDNIVFIRDGKYIEDGVNLYNNDINNYTFYLTPGEYKVSSTKLGVHNFKIENVNQEYKLTLDYETGEFNLIEVTAKSNTR